MDRGAWWAAVHRVAQSQIRLKRLSMNACIGEGDGNPFQIFLPRESQGQRILVGCHLWVTESQSDTAEVTWQQQQSIVMCIYLLKAGDEIEKKKKNPIGTLGFFFFFGLVS